MGTTLLLAVLLGAAGGTTAAALRRHLDGPVRPVVDLAVVLLLVGAAWSMSGGGAQDGVVPAFLLVYLVATSVADARAVGLLPRAEHLVGHLRRTPGSGH